MLFVIIAVMLIPFASAHAGDLAQAATCSDKAVVIYATKTNETAATVALTAFDKCKSLWIEAAEDASAKLPRFPGDVASLLGGYREVYLEHARVLALDLRAGAHPRPFNSN